jgi:predicted acetyltransferase
VSVRVRPARSLAEFREGVTCIGAYFNWHPSDEAAEAFARLLPFDRMHVALDGGRIVGGTGAFPFRLSVPGGSASCAGVTVVGVQTTHRRQGILSRMMDAQLRDVRERGEPIAALWASEETIYGRYGYGLAATMYRMRLPRQVAAIHGARPRGISARLVEHEEAVRLFPRIYERELRRTPGLVHRSRDWWLARNLNDEPHQRRGAGPLQRLLVERDGVPVAYALYRISQQTTAGEWTKTLRVVEAFAVDDPALHEVWRYLLAVDWMDTIEAWHLPIDHPLVLSLTRVNKAELTLFDAIWVRPVDVRAALEARSYAGTGRVAVEVTTDPHFPDNVGLWQVEAGSVKPGRGRADVRLPIASLGSAYLGGFSFTALVRAGLAEEARPKGLERADAFFRSGRAPICAEVF